MRNFGTEFGGAFAGELRALKAQHADARIFAVGDDIGRKRAVYCGWALAVRCRSAAVSYDLARPVCLMYR